MSPQLRIRGDELDLSAASHFELVRKIKRDVRDALPDTVENSCSYAWPQFLRHQPDRDRRWQGRLSWCADSVATKDAVPAAQRGR